MNKEENLERWKKTRSMGFTRFMLEIAFLRYALPVTLFSQLVTYLFRYGFTTERMGEVFSERNIYYWLVAVLTSGLVFGSTIWLWGERAMKKSTAQAD